MQMHESVKNICYTKAKISFLKIPKCPNCTLNIFHDHFDDFIFNFLQFCHFAIVLEFDFILFPHDARMNFHVWYWKIHNILICKLIFWKAPFQCQKWNANSLIFAFCNVFTLSTNPECFRIQIQFDHWNFCKNVCKWCQSQVD